MPGASHCAAGSLARRETRARRMSHVAIGLERRTVYKSTATADFDPHVAFVLGRSRAGSNPEVSQRLSNGFALALVETVRSARRGLMPRLREIPVSTHGGQGHGDSPQQCINAVPVRTRYPVATCTTPGGVKAPSPYRRRGETHARQAHGWGEVTGKMCGMFRRLRSRHHRGHSHYSTDLHPPAARSLGCGGFVRRHRHVDTRENRVTQDRLDERIVREVTRAKVTSGHLCCTVALGVGPSKPHRYHHLAVRYQYLAPPSGVPTTLLCSNGGRP